MNTPLPKLLIIGYVWPEPNSSAAGTRMIQLINLFTEYGWQVTFASPANRGDHKVDLTKLGITEQEIELNNSSFDDFLTELSPDTVIFDRFMMEEQFGWRVEEFAPQAVRVVNTEDLHSLRASRHKLLKSHLKKQQEDKAAGIEIDRIGLTDTGNLYQNMILEDLTKREIASLFRSDIALMISKFEMSLLTDKFQLPSSQLCYLPFQYCPPSLDTLPSYSQRAHFVTIGNFRHEPNWDAVRWLKEVIWPLIKAQIPEAEMHIYGAYPPPKATALHNPKQGFYVKGWAEDAYKVIQEARVLIAPLRFGAGIKGKLAEAMLNGTPSVTTDIGAEAMYNPKTENWPGAIGNNEHVIAQKAVELYQNREIWEQKQKLGFDLVKAHYLKTEMESPVNSSDSPAHNFMQQLQQAKQNIELHRAQHFMGSMLNHHHHKSTKFMAQWIEAKNKLL